MLAARGNGGEVYCFERLRKYFLSPVNQGAFHVLRP